MDVFVILVLYILAALAAAALLATMRATSEARRAEARVPIRIDDDDPRRR